ncbi:MAG: hypothetical protein J4G05_12275 [Chlorobi bacterium]|nr:hypothetical protein [Chlorobiota bacterium]
MKRDRLLRGLKQAPNEKPADSLKFSIPSETPQHIFGQVEFPGKATAVVGMRRAGKRCPKARKILFTLTCDEIPAHLPGDIIAQPTYKWLPGASV